MSEQNDNNEVTEEVVFLADQKERFFYTYHGVAALITKLYTEDNLGEKDRGLQLSLLEHLVKRLGHGEKFSVYSRIGLYERDEKKLRIQYGREMDEEDSISQFLKEKVSTHLKMIEVEDQLVSSLCEKLGIKPLVLE